MLNIYILKLIQQFKKILKKSSMNKLNIKQLPKTKRMAVDQMHPVKKIQDTRFFQDEKTKFNQLGALYGSALPMMLKYQRSILGQPERLPGLKSSFLSLQSHMNRLNKIQFEDCLNRGELHKRISAHEYFQKQFD